MRLTKMKLCAVVGGILALSACGESRISDSEVFTLYQNAPSDPAARVGIATFDMAWGAGNNHHFCIRTAAFFQAEWDASGGKSGVSGAKETRHWCEKGRFRK